MQFDNTSSLIKWAVFVFLILAALIGYSLYSTNKYIDKEKNGNMEAYLSSLSDSLEAEEVIDPSEIVDTSRQRILFIGDSMAEGLKYPLGEYAKFNGHQLTTISKTSATIVSWVGRDSLGRLKRAIDEVKPTYLIISLGSNEIFTRQLESYDKYLDNIINQIGELKYVWIGPPKWKEDNGLTQLIEDKVGTFKYYHSEELGLPRSIDGIHPTYQGYYTWADSFATWLMQTCPYKILLEKPTKEEEVKEDSTLIE